MRWYFLVVAILMAGCNNVMGPFEHRPVERVDDPRLSIAQQQREARSRLPLPIESPQILPSSGVEGPGLIIRQ
jgi:hypothetical protein